MKFLLTKELGRLAKWLRILGFDARYEPSVNKSFVMIEALREERILITRNQRFGRRHGGTVIFIKSNTWEEQLKELCQTLDLEPDPNQLFRRCSLCNESLIKIEKAHVEKSVPAYVYETQHEFMQCPVCARIYWKGTHGGNAEEILEKLIKAAKGEGR